LSIQSGALTALRNSRVGTSCGDDVMLMAPSTGIECLTLPLLSTVPRKSSSPCWDGEKTRRWTHQVGNWVKGRVSGVCRSVMSSRALHIFTAVRWWWDGRSQLLLLDNIIRMIMSIYDEKTRHKITIVNLKKQSGTWSHQENRYILTVVDDTAVCWPWYRQRKVVTIFPIYIACCWMPRTSSSNTRKNREFRAWASVPRVIAKHELGQRAPLHNDAGTKMHSREREQK
jgi:hypothetical protein